jgi:hypothetical protein
VVAYPGGPAVVKDLQVMVRHPTMYLVSPVISWANPPQGVVGVKVPQDDRVGGEEGGKVRPGIVWGTVPREDVETHHREGRGGRRELYADRLYAVVGRDTVLKVKAGE